MLNFNTRTTTTSCLTLRLADNITLMTDLELHHLIRSIYCKYSKLSQKCLDVAELRINFTRLSTLKDPKKSLGWPGDAGDSETLAGVVSKLDEECSRRCDEWDMSRANLPLSLLWTRFSFRFVRNFFRFILASFGCFPDQKEVNLSVKC